jgi:hypothetical protein
MGALESGSRFLPLVQGGVHSCQLESGLGIAGSQLNRAQEVRQ